ncbi:MAG: ABC transporter substrate-binding protein [Spirochaetes bacterium]|nr:ABC transporter substrate-binding protein [Spirochaetota bacterium]
MKKIIMKSLAMVLILVFLSSTIIAQTKIDTKKYVKLNGYLLGGPPPGMEDVVDELNKRLKQDINAEVEINHIDWGDLQSKYPLLLISGQDFDFIYTANWAFYFQQAARGAFLEITEDMLKNYMPLHFKALPREAYAETKVKGKMYMIPTSTPDKKMPVAIIRADLRKKYNVPEIKKFSDLEKYFDVIKRNEKEMVPMLLDKSYDIGQPMGALRAEFGDYYFDVLYSTGGGSGCDFGLDDKSNKVIYTLEGEDFANQLKAAKIMKSWYEKGYVNKDAFSNSVQSKTSFNLGKSAIGFGNSQNIQSNIAEAIAKGWEVEIIPLLNINGHYIADPYINNGVALPATCKNPERTLMFLDRIMQDKSYDYLVYFGIEGKHYVIKDGKIDLPPGLTADKNPYPPDASGFWFTNKDHFLPLASWTKEYGKLKNDMKRYLVPSIFQVIAFDTTKIKTELATVNQVMVQYGNPIGIGAVKDVEEQYKLLDQKLKAAGVMKIKAEIQKQVDAYLKYHK